VTTSSACQLDSLTTLDSPLEENVLVVQQFFDDLDLGISNLPSANDATFIQHLEKKENPVTKKISDIIDTLKIPGKWKAESINPPNITCKLLAKRVSKDIYDSYEEIPIRIAPTIEEGVFFYYKNFENNIEMYIEVYNDLDIAAVLFRKKEIIKSFDICNEDFSEVFSLFQNV